MNVFVCNVRWNYLIAGRLVDGTVNNIKDMHPQSAMLNYIIFYASFEKDFIK